MLIPTLEKKDPALSSIYYLTTGGLSGDVKYLREPTKKATPGRLQSWGITHPHLTSPDNSGERRFTHQRVYAYER